MQNSTAKKNIKSFQSHMDLQNDADLHFRS